MDDESLPIQTRESEPDLGQGRFEDIERAMFHFQQATMKEISAGLLDVEQAQFMAAKK